jgi:hypothetical protein
MLALLPLTALSNCARAEGRFAVANGYTRLTVADSGSVSLRFDPTGQAKYSSWQAQLAPYGVVEPGTVVVGGKGVTVSGARYLSLRADSWGYFSPFDTAQNLRDEGSMGQSFAVPEGGGWLCGVWAFLTCSRQPDSAVTLRLRRDGPAGEVLASRRVDPLPENARVSLELPKPVPPGAFYLEVGERKGACYWWGCKSSVYDGGTAFLGGQPVMEQDRCFGYEVADVGVLDWEALLDGAQVRCSFTVREQALKGAVPALALTFPWQRDGYDTTDPATTPFRHLLTDTGYFLLVENFKRLASNWALEKQCASLRLRGTNGFDLQVTHGRDKLTPRMEADAMHFLLGPKAGIAALPSSDELPSWFPRFFTSDLKTDEVLNRFNRTFLTGHTSTACTFEFDAARLAWLEGPIHDSFQRVLRHFGHRVDPDGYVWSRGNSRGWDDSDCEKHDARLYDTNAAFILACWRFYVWTGDKALLLEFVEPVRRATDYLLDKLHGREGVLIVDSPEHDGVPSRSRASNYWDVLPMGHKDAYANAFFLPALQAASELERASGNAQRADELRRLIPLARREYNRTFWDKEKGRYSGWIDAEGTRHDCGMTHLNMVAATHGLADADQVLRMYRWMAEEPTAAGAPDTFSRWLFAPRSNTLHCAEQRDSYPYDEWCEDGGALLWTAYYEIVSRARFLGADDAWRRFKEILARYDLPDHLVGGNPLCRGETNNDTEGRGSVGTWGAFPESGLAPTAFLSAFLGIRADLDGLHVRPNLPTELESAGVEGLVFRGRRLKVTCYRTQVVVEWDGNTLGLPVPPLGEVLVTEQALGDRN